MMSRHALAAFTFMALGIQGEDNRMLILPVGDQEVRVGKNLVLTCRAQVPSLELIRDLRWYNPQGLPVQQDERVYSEEQPREAATALFIKHVSLQDEGTYSCRATYASNQKLEASVNIALFVGITWEDAPVNQYARLGEDYKIRCKVRARPPASIDWLKESLIVSTGSQYVIESDGLRILGVSKENAGTYTCRARVPEKGELEERDIQLDVQEPPSWVQKPFDVKGVEQARVDMLCGALGAPPPKYTWVDKHGIDVTEREGWKLDEITGTLTGYQVRRQDEGEYTCIAENNAGRMEASATLTVIIRPKVQELYNKTTSVGDNVELECKASGDPLPRIIWRKWSSNTPYLVGGQPDDSRIIVREGPIKAPDYTEGERNWMSSVLSIEGAKRLDDGLYECLAENEGGKFYKSGHITTHFKPSFEDQPMTKEWSWDQRPVNLTCIARSIPNATISWWHNNEEIGRDDQDEHFKIVGHGPRSDLIITPLGDKYYKRYRCKAENPLGVSEFEIELEKASVPGPIQQVIIGRNTATTLEFQFVPPVKEGGLPIDSYAVEYKRARDSWGNSSRRVWPIAVDGLYVLENLRPTTTYDFRFGCKNRVGFSKYAHDRQITTTKKREPEPPFLSIQTRTKTLIGDPGNVIELPADQEYEVSWKIPRDNGEYIDFFLLSYYAVKALPEKARWDRIDDITKVEIPNRGNVRWGLNLPYKDTFYQVNLAAHNRLGYSEEAQIIVKTPSGGNDVPPPGATKEFSSLAHTLSGTTSLLFTALLYYLS